jgi:uncharacterized damage-inducible protein DinB
MMFMDPSTLEALQYPLGKYEAPATIDEVQRKAWIRQIASLPVQLSSAVHGLHDEELDTPYREGGWTVRQVVHHVADSHLNSQIRFRWALTEDVPLIKAYHEKLWAELPDARTLPVKVSLDLLDGLHRRWIALLLRMTEADFKRRLRHPEAGELTLEWMLGLYAWHGRHHTAHITRLKERMGW